MSQLARLETGRLVLSPRRAEHVEAIARIDRDPEVFRYSEVRAFIPAVPPRRSIARKAMLGEIARESAGAVWAIERKPAQGVIGLVALAAEAPAILGLPPQPDALFLSYRLARADWGQGLGTEAAAAAMEYGFGVLSARAILAFCHAANARSRRVLVKLGLTETGMLLARKPGPAATGEAGQIYVCYRTEASTHRAGASAGRRGA